MHQLDEIEARIVGCLIEKSIVTPDQYPMTLNSLQNACNQKSARDPILALTQGEVLHAIRVLEQKHLLRTEENFKSRADKYSQRFCGTRYSDLQLNAAEVALICLLLLRGPQTPGEMKARSARLHTFADNAAVVVALDALENHEAGALILKLPRTPGRKDSEYTHLFSGSIDVDAYASEALARKPETSPNRGSIADLTERVEKLESVVVELKSLLD